MVDIVLGGFYGDEGKGKVIDYLAKEADIIVRATGGSNTGNTVVLNEKRCIIYLKEKWIKINKLKGKCDNPDVDGDFGPQFPLEVKCIEKALNMFL